MSASSDYPRGYAGDARETATAIAADYRTIALNRISWGAVLAGVVTALVAHLLLNVLGIGIGLTTLDPIGGENPAAADFSIASAAWWTISGIISSFAGGFVAGRLTGQPDTSTGGWHGFVSWALTTLVIVYLLTTSASALVGGALNRLGGLGQSAVSTATQIAGGQNNAYTDISNQIRELSNTEAGRAAGESLTAAVRAAVTGNEAEARQATDRAVDALARARGVSPDEARRQIEGWRAQYAATAADARRAAEATADIASQVAIYGVIALLLGGVAGYFGGTFGRPNRESVAFDTDSARTPS